jgi:hypothetical protein
MGQQQLLLIALGIIVVSIAVIVGINQFSTSAKQANKDAIISDLINLSSIARAHFKRPVEFGGGGNSFANFKIPTAIDSTANGTIEHTQTGHNPDHIHFEATGKETGEDGINPIRIEARITIHEIKLTERN